MDDYTGPRPRELAVVQGPLVRVVELAAREGVPGAVVTVDGSVHVWVPLDWCIPVPLGDEGEATR